MRPDNTDCTFLYFNPSGKWKYEGRGRFPKYPGSGWHEIDRAAIYKENDAMPGVSGDAGHFVVVVLPDQDCDHPFAYPRMLQPTRISV